MYLQTLLVTLLSPLFLVLFILPSIATAQFQFFNNFFEGQHQQQPQEKQNVASDSSWYQQVVENGTNARGSIRPGCPSVSTILWALITTFFLLGLLHSCSSDLTIPKASLCQRFTNACLAPCTHYLCPGTLACVHFPHHCPCAFPAVEDKVELAEGSAICVSKGGYKAGEAARKIQLARKGVL